eukprot:TRINITY_DN1343_c0_g1_i2.p1 TRINITY_DN1343_c0_g1~~TRINITY_DN1343_c0_g1_i2.p1  ORF type:complete len:455 (-),score=115.95 TRINITY_DN1343_c0_g1_i2:81-1445(-)
MLEENISQLLKVLYASIQILFWKQWYQRRVRGGFETQKMFSSRVVNRCSFRRFCSSRVDIFHPTETHRQIRETVKSFTQNEVVQQAREHDNKEMFNRPLFNKLGDLGLLGITVPERYGGAGLDATATVIVHEELSTADPGFTLSYLAHSLLFSNNLAVNGSEEQCSRFLPNATVGEFVCGMCMSEPSVGTDVLALSTNARKEGDNWILNGRKMWITNGALNDSETGDAFLVYARTGPKDISLFIVEKGMEGFSLGQRIKGKLGMRASPTAELVFENVSVPHNNLVGKEGEAIKHMMRNLELERLGLAAISLGIARACLEVMINYAKERKSFGKSIINYGQIQAHIANSYAEYMAAKSYVYQVAQKLDLVSGTSNRIDSDGVKLFSAKIAKDIADRAIQVLGGNGYVAEYNVERLWRDAKLLEIGGGTNEAHQKNMSRDLSKIEALELNHMLSHL